MFGLDGDHTKVLEGVNTGFVYLSMPWNLKENAYAAFCAALLWQQKNDPLPL